MKTLKEMFAIAAEINAAAKLEEKAMLIPPGSVASVCDDTGSLDSEGSPVEGAPRLMIDIQEWREGTKPLTEKGRAEMAAESAAIERILNVARKHCTVERTGDGSGEYGPITCYELAS